MNRIRLAPSMERADILNYEREIKALEKAGADLLHIDLMDTTYSDRILLSTQTLPAFRKITDIPLDIHLLISHPERLLPVVLNHCEGGYVSFQLETSAKLTALLKQVKVAGGKGAVTLTPGTPIGWIEDIMPHLSMVNLLIRDDGIPEAQLSQHMLGKIKRLRQMLDEAGRADISVEVDGSITLDDARLVTACGADTLVLGSKTIFRPGIPYEESTRQLRCELDCQ